MRSTRALLHTENFRNNLDICLRIAAGRKVCLAVKADGYGHGAIFAARVALEAGISHLGVATAQEAVEIVQSFPSAKVILLGLCAPYELEELVAMGVELVCPDAETLELIAKMAKHTGKTAAVHLKTDTGMGRIGCRPEELAELAQTALGKGLNIAGVATHFPVAEIEDPSFTQKQVSLFEKSVAGLRAAGIDPGLLHAANSGGLTLHANARFDMIRPGIMAYGYPAGHFGFEALGLKPVMELRSVAAFIKEVPAGTGISYGLRHHTATPRWIATLPVGYADGLPRLASGKLSFTHVTAAKNDETRWGQCYNQVGTICMDQCMIDLGPSRDATGRPVPCPVKRWEEFSIFGPSPVKETAATVAAAIGTISYEICCGISGRVPRLAI